MNSNVKIILWESEDKGRTMERDIRYNDGSEDAPENMLKSTSVKASPKVLVYIPCYNHEKYICEAMESALNQTYRNIEVFVVDDGSTDHSGELIDGYSSDSRVRIVHLKENTAAIGTARELERYLKTSDASYLAEFSSDDLWHPDKIRRQVEFMEKNKSYAACFTWDEFKIEDGGTLELDEEYSHVANRDRYQWIGFFMSPRNCINASSALIRCSVYSELGGLNWTYRNTQDYNLWLSIVRRYPVYIMPECLTVYRRHEGELSVQRGGEVRNINEIFAILLTNYSEISDEDYKKSFFDRFIYYNSSSHDEIMAEKIIYLLQSRLEINVQIGMLMYMQNSANRDLMDILENRFGVSNVKFHEFTAAHGMVLMQTPNEDVRCGPDRLTILLDYLDGGADSGALSGMKTSLLRELADNIMKAYGSLDYYVKLRDAIRKQQDMVERSEGDWCSILIGEQYVGDIAAINTYLSENEKLRPVYSIVPLKSRMFLDGSCAAEIDADVDMLEMFDYSEHRLRYYWELDSEPAKVYCYGCTGEDYEVDSLLDATSLAVSLYRLNKTKEQESDLILRDVEMGMYM